MSQDAARKTEDLFEEVALVVSELASTHRVEDGFVWELMRSLDGVRARALNEVSCPSEGVSDTPESVEPHRTHPAVEAFLTTLGRS